jgi:spore coat protein CotH
VQRLNGKAGSGGAAPREVAVSRQPMASAAGSGSTGDADGGTRGQPAESDAGISPDAGHAFDGPVLAEPNDAATFVFDPQKLLTYNIVVADADLATLDRDPSAEQYVPGMLEFEGQVIGSIGVRYKGGYSGFQPPCSNGKGAPRMGKCSYKLAFDQFDSEARFYGLKKLNLHSMNADPSLMHDRLGYALYRDFGVAAPRAVHARVYVNGEAQGLFIVVEQIDGRFTRARFAEGGKGNVYKEIWPLYSDEMVYTNALETNEKAAQVQGMVAFAQQVKRGDAEAITSFIDRDYTLRYLAVDRVIANDDGFTHFWCSDVAHGNSPSNIGNHNYYWYQEDKQTKFWLIPWDLDITFAYNDDAHLTVPWDQSAECTCTGQGMGFQVPAACDPLFEDFISWRSDYEQQVDAFLAGPFAADSIDAKLNAWAPQIESSVSELADTPTWQAALSKLHDDLASLRSHRGYAY